MCGIVGVARRAGVSPAEAQAVRRMAGAIHHRGPDEEGFHDAGPVVIGMRRLSIIDLSGGHQPIASEDESVWVVGNGEIYNFRALRAELEKRGHRFRTGSDIEVIVHLYEEHGDDFVRHLSGMFGLALWDARRRRLILARDRFGQKPLYFTRNGSDLAFGSEVKSLLQLPGVRAQIDPEALHEHLTLGYAIAPRSLFLGIEKLPPATCLIWDEQGTRLESYWSLPVTVNSGLSESEWVERIRAELRRAVTEHMVSDVPIGAFLSGGIDSSAIVALMAEQSDRPVNTYSIGYAGRGAAEYYNELSYARVVADRFATHHHEIPVAPDLTALLPKLLWHVEEPLCDSAIITTWLVSELAAQSVKVILSGVGGDELFAGYKRYLGAHYVRRYHRIPSWVRQQIVRPLAAALPSGRHSRAMDLARYARKFIDTSELPWHERYRRYVQICDLPILNRGAVRPDRFDAILDAEGSADELLRLMRIDALTQLPEDLLLLTDKMTMAASIECRVPFLDHQLAELAAQVPESIKLRNGELKYLLKRVLTGIVPPEILNRGKRGFGAPLGAWFKSELRALRDAVLNRQTIENRGWLSWPVVHEALARHDANRDDYTDLIIVLVNLELWSQIFLDGR
ncbi:MAG TPA: asparagine synthase (glutamine-hydrolyzing), partial [Steroidobacteraceae bacterium]